MFARRGLPARSCAAVFSAALAAWLLALSVPALAQLPRTYDVRRVDSPAPGASDTFGFGIVNAGDLNGDGRDDLLSSQGHRVLNDGNGAENGELFVISGADGSTIDTVPAPEPDTDAAGNDRAAAFGTYIGRIGQNTAAAPRTDLASCPGGSTDADPFCDDLVVGPADGVPDIVVSALHVDRASPAAADGTAEDIGRVYVLDGATRAVLKRLDMPQADVDDLADETEQLIPSAPATPVRAWFGRSVLNPGGQTPCAGNQGIGPCAVGAQSATGVRSGDLTGGGSPDVVVGASAYKYEEAEGTNPACNDTASPNDVCQRSGRSYMYRGEDIVGSDPETILGDDPGETAWNIVNPYAQADQAAPDVINSLELFGHSMSPVGDVGTCTINPGVGNFCPSTNWTGAADGRPEIVVSAFRVDYPTSGPDDPENYEIGVNLLLDGATGSVLQTYRHPDPDPGSIFGFSVMNQPAVGNMGGSAAPDVYLPAAGQDTDTYRGEGIGFVMNGGNVVNGNIIDLQRFRDPTPDAGGSFGTTAAGVGNIAGEPTRNEILIGAFSTHNPPVNDTVISDVHVFDPTTGDPLQTIADPDQQPVSNFGIGLAPMGDQNGDGFLDFAASAARYDLGATVDAGRVYLFTSNNTPLPTTNPPPTTPPADTTPAPAPTETTTIVQAAAAAGRAVELAADKERVPRGRPVELRGQLEAFANPAGCAAEQAVEVQRRLPGSARYNTIARVRTGADGAFTHRTRTDRTSYYRAIVGQTDACLGAASGGERVNVSPALRVETERARLDRSRRIAVQVQCRTSDRPCDGTLRIRTRTRLGGARRTLGTRAFQTPGDARERTVRIGVTRKIARLLRRAGSVRATVFATGRDARGNATTIASPLTVRTR